MDSRTKIERIAAVSRAFTPGAPVSELDMLAGRMHQLTDVVSVVSQSGQHVGLYGERGVGKTSLANVLAEFFDARLHSRFQSVLVNCVTEDDYTSLWQGIFEELRIADEEADQHLTPEAVRRRLQDLDPPALIVIDELDRLEDDEALTSLADTIKTLSDHAVETTLVLVGVARSIGDLIGEHASIARSVIQTEMPRMSPGELHEIISNGCDAAGVLMRQNAAVEIVSLSEGLPHYTHLLAQNAGQRAIQDDRDEIRLDDVMESIPRAVDRHTIRSDYQLATRSARQDALFREVLLACALAPKNELGFFTSGSIRDPLEVIAGRRLDIPAFSNHLSQFLEAERGAVLQREGSSRRYFYRFTDPIFQPYVILNGISTGLISDEDRKRFQQVDAETDLTPSDFETTEPQQLF